MRPFVLHEREIQFIRDLREIPSVQREVILDAISRLAEKHVSSEKQPLGTLRLVLVRRS